MDFCQALYYLMDELQPFEFFKPFQENGKCNLVLTLKLSKKAASLNQAFEPFQENFKCNSVPKLKLSKKAASLNQDF